MTPYAHEVPPRSAHQKILDEEQTTEDHVVDLLPAYFRIMDIAQAGMEKGNFLKVTPRRATVDVILSETPTTL